MRVDPKKDVSVGEGRIGLALDLRGRERLGVVENTDIVINGMRKRREEEKVISSVLLFRVQRENGRREQEKGGNHRQVHWQFLISFSLLLHLCNYVFMSMFI